MADPTFDERLRSFILSCDDTRASLRRSLGLISQKLKLAGLAKKEYWVLNGLKEKLSDLYPPEIEIATIFSNAANGWNLSHSDVLRRCDDVLTILDAAACGSKETLHLEVGASSPVLYEHKCYLKSLVNFHWEVLDGLKMQGPDVLGLIADQVVLLEKSLRKLGWFRNAFIGYAHKDNEANHFLDDLLAAIKEDLAAKHHIFLWWDWKPRPAETDDEESQGLLVGQEWNQEIERRLELFDVAVVLTSPRFVESEYSQLIEAKRLLERRRTEGLYLINIRLEACMLDSDPQYHRAHSFPQGDRYVSNFYDRSAISGELIARYKAELLPAMVDAFSAWSDAAKVKKHIDYFREPPLVLGRTVAEGDTGLSASKPA
jgi:hypothetical protein